MKNQARLLVAGFRFRTWAIILSVLPCFSPPVAAADNHYFRNLQGLAQIWFLSDVDYEIERRPKESSVGISFAFTSSDAIEDDMMRTDIMDAETCAVHILEQEDEDIRLLLNEIFSVTSPVSADAIADGFGSRGWEAAVDVKLPDTLFDEDVSNETSAFLGESLLTFCVRVATTLPPGGDDDFSGLPVTVVGLLVEIDDSLNATIQDFEFPSVALPTPPPRARAAFCDQDYNELSTHPLLLEGDLIRICIFPPEEGSYRMGTVDFFQYEEYVIQELVDHEDRNSTIASETTMFQSAILPGGIPAFNQLTHFSCTPEVCVIESLLFAGFFEPNTKIWATGYATFYYNEDTGNVTDTGEDSSIQDEEVLGSDVFLAFETLLQITNVLPSTNAPTAPTTKPSATPTLNPTSAPSQSPSTTPSALPSVPSSSAYCYAASGWVARIFIPLAGAVCPCLWW